MANLGKDRGDSILSKMWVSQQFEQIDKANALILKRIEELSKQSAKETAAILAELKKIQDRANAYVIPELEAIIIEVTKRATSIDQKVPDKNVPPSTGTGGKPTNERTM